MLEHLRKGELDNLKSNNPYLFKSLINDVRMANDRCKIVNQIYDDIKDTYPEFCLRIIYDLEEYKDKAIYLLGKAEVYKKIDDDLFINILINTSYGMNAIISNLDKVIMCSCERLTKILDYLFVDYENNIDLINRIKEHNNLHIRYLYLKYLLDKDMDNFNFDDISKYLVKYNENTNEFEFMNHYDISKICYMFYEKGNIEMYIKLKDFILKNYKYNCLAELLLLEGRHNPELIEEFKKESDLLFQTSSSYQYEIYQRYSEYVSEEIINNFLRYYNMFIVSVLYDNKLSKIFRNELWHDLVASVDKYLSLSNDTSYRFLQSGSCSDVYKVGNYIFKLCDKKYNKFDMLCPNNYLVLKNLEERFVCDFNDKVIAGYEVQNYLTRSAREVPEKIFDKYNKALSKLGFVFDDHFISDRYGDNCMLLDSYKDADCSDPEKLPKWFKEYPLVVIDRDLFSKTKVKK